MKRFDKTNFKRIIFEIEKMEAKDENIWVPIGILEYMYDDNIGLFDRYFHSTRRNVDELWNKLSPQSMHRIQEGEIELQKIFEEMQ